MLHMLHRRKAPLIVRRRDVLKIGSAVRLRLTPIDVDTFKLELMEPDPNFRPGVRYQEVPLISDTDR